MLFDGIVLQNIPYADADNDQLCDEPRQIDLHGRMQLVGTIALTASGRITERAVKRGGTTWLRFVIGDE